MKSSMMALKKKQLGQAMTEYALMAFAMMAVSFGLFEAFMKAYEYYSRVFYMLLVLPIP